MEESTIWWVAAGVIVAAELVTGTFYLLMFGLGLAAGAVAAHAGLGLSGQMVAAAAVGGGAVAAWHLYRGRQVAGPPASANRDINLDIGETILIEHWQPDGTASVRYRGAQWTAVHRHSAAPSTGLHRVAEVSGSRLVVEKT